MVAGDYGLILSGLVKVNVRRDGYDKHGAYWGAGLPVFMFELHYAAPDGRYGRPYYGDTAVRARTKQAALQQIKKWHNIVRVDK